ncbi:MAG: hypothetical protein EPO01_13705 [Aquabacterium sp.]|jgi:hypothetical protein|nr:MAG: hypothetical protein EPO12_13355 [Aquabacterium sp.]TAL20206.1 MAG: hypothetical protein EPO01_13705 [Aquabacterium sp.]
MTLTHEQFIYRRTLSGQTEALLWREKLSTVERGLLLSVNGYTPLSVLMQLRRDGQAALDAIDHLVEMQLVEAVDELDTEADEGLQPSA